MAVIVEQKTFIDRVRDFFVSPRLEDALSELQTHPAPPPPPRSTSEIFESHIQEANYAAKNSKSISVAWDETEGRGISPEMRRSGGQYMSERERKDTLLQVYLQNPWVSASINNTAKRITSGGYAIEPKEQGKGNDAHREILKEFVLLINDDWDFLQLIRSIITDLLIYGEAYAEILYKGGVPWKLVKVDCLSMTYEADPHGAITAFKQQVGSQQQPNTLSTDTIIRWWWPHPRSNVLALSPIELILDAVNIDKKMVIWVNKFFSNGAKAPYYIDGGENMDQDAADRYLEWFTENFTGLKNANAPQMTYGGATIKEYKSGAIDVDFKTGRDRNRSEILAAMGTPPMIVGIIENAGLNGTGDNQAKDFQYNTCDPIKQLVLEKLNFRIVQCGFKFDDYVITTRYADYRSDADIAEVQDKKIRNGTRTPDEVRQEEGRPPYSKGGNVPIFAVSKEVIPLARLGDLEDEQRQSAQVDLQTKQAQADLAKTQAEKAKEPPQPVPAPLQAHMQPGQSAPNGQQPPQLAQDGKQVPPQVKSQQKPPKAKESTQEAHTGMMVAFMLDPETAKQLAIPGGEPIEDMHVTLAYLPPDENEAINLDRLKKELASFASNAIPLMGATGGLGRFAPSTSSDGLSPVIALINVPGLQKWRTQLVQRLEDMRVHVANDFDYTPHCTLDYVDADAPLPVDSVPTVPLMFDTLCLAIGDERAYFKIGDGQYPQYWDDKEGK